MMSKEFLLGGMMEEPLLTTAALQHAARVHGRTEVLSVEASGARTRLDWAAVLGRAEQLAQALVSAGVRVGEGERLATLAWNSHRHLELYYAVPGLGAVLHTLNPRLHVDLLAKIIAHAEATWIFVDPHALDLAIALHKQGLKHIHWVILSDRAGAGDLSQLPFDYRIYDDWIRPTGNLWQWPVLSERLAALLCYTSGTTGEPKGVLYSHRSTVLHAMALMAPDAQNLSARDTVLPVVPMFHANAWGLPYLCAMVGTRLVLPGPRVDGERLFALMHEEAVSVSVGVPTVWWGLLAEIRRRGFKPQGLERLFVGGAACPLPLGRAFQEEWGIEMIQGWGMTETSPVGSFSAAIHGARVPARYARQGRPIFGIRMQVLDREGGGVPEDDASFGELLVRGHWVAREYYRETTPLLREGWLPTGDVVRVDQEKSMLIVDRLKDMIRSGGEWISSMALEAVALTSPEVADAAVIARPDERWGERPLLIVVPAPGATPSKACILTVMKAALAAWQIPDDVVFIDEIPRTATGKIDKKALRARFCDVVPRTPD